MQFENKDPVLIRAILEYLYKGHYKPAPCQGIPEVRTWPANSTPVDSTPSVSAPVGSALFGSGPVGSAPVGSAPVGSAPVGSAPTDPLSNEVAMFNAAYFHARLHGEADYFMIDDLKSETKKLFCASLPALVDFRTFLPDCQVKKDSFVVLVMELYSQEANYSQLRADLVQYILNNLSSFRSSSSIFHIMDDDLLKDLPGFTFDVCQAMLNKGFKQPSSADSSDSSRPYHTSLFSQPAIPQGGIVSQQPGSLFGGSRGAFSFSTAAPGGNSR